MSYRGVKRVLGESNLERKCRRLFGISMVVLITGSFYAYSVQNDKLVLDQYRFLGEVVANAAWNEAHFLGLKDWLPSEEAKTYFGLFTKKTAKSVRTRDYQWEALYPQNQQGINQPRDEEEWRLMKKWEDVGRGLHSDADVDAFEKQNKDELQVGRIVRSTPKDSPPGSAESAAWYQYYQPVFAKADCVLCHKTSTKVRRPDLQVGELLAVLRVDMDIQDTRDAQAGARALLAALGIVTASLAMFALWAIVRYVIIKPLTHLRDVSDAVRRGEIDQRVVIHTGDEFEEVGNAFNRMVRQLLQQQDKLRDVNGELDGKIDELAQVNMRLFEMNKVKSDFLATVSHELRTPLNSILGFSDLLAKASALEEKQRRYATNIERSGRQLLEMINDILDLAKIESGRMEVRPASFDIGAVVITQCDLARPLSEKKHIELDCEIAEDLPAMRQDQGKIEQVLNNLLSNAIKFTPDGGRIHVSARQDRRGDLRLVVADTGVGISEHEQVAVFEKFRQGSNVLAGGNAMTREYSGTGLGLSIVRELCRLLGGDVTLESEVGKGSEFTVILPWTLADQTRVESPLAEELRQLANARTDSPLAAAASRPDAGGEI